MEGFARTIISQFSSSPTIVAMLTNFNDCIDPSQDFDAFYNLVWNVDTAVGYGLDVWGRIVDVGRIVEVPSGEITFGFEEAGTASAAPFNQGTFYAGTSLTSNYALSDDAYRVLILAKALANISDGSIRSINQILLSLFPGRGNCYATDGLDMTMTYTFEFDLSPVEFAIVSQTGVLPRPPGVLATVVQI
jgi:hypothetical protein